MIRGEISTLPARREETSQGSIDNGLDDDAVQHCCIDLPNAEPPVEPIQEIPQVEAQQEKQPERPMETEMEVEPSIPPTPIEPRELEPAAAKTLVDQDWYSGSDEESEEAGGTGDNEQPTAHPNPVEEGSQPLETLSMNLDTKKPATTKKGSIFKSRSTGVTNGNKRRALYKHKWFESDKESGTPESASTGNATLNTASGSHSNAGAVAFEEEFETSQLTRVVTYPETDMDFTDETEAITSIRCGKKVKRVSFHIRMNLSALLKLKNRPGLTRL